MTRALLILILVGAGAPARAGEPARGSLDEAFPPCVEEPCRVERYGAYILITDAAALAMMSWYAHHAAQPPAPCCEDCACDDMTFYVPLFAAILYGGMSPMWHAAAGRRGAAWASGALRFGLPAATYLAARELDAPIHPGTALVGGVLAAIAIDVLALARVRVAVEPADRGRGGTLGLAGCF